MDDSKFDVPDPLAVAAAAVEKLGAWKSWTPGRQTWYLRKRLSLTQRDLGDLSGVTQHRISEIENGAEVLLATLIQLWMPLGYSPTIVPDVLGRTLKGLPPRRSRMARKTYSSSCEGKDVAGNISEAGGGDEKRDG